MRTEFVLAVIKTLNFDIKEAKPAVDFISDLYNKSKDLDRKGTLLRRIQLFYSSARREEDYNRVFFDKEKLAVNFLDLRLTRKNSVPKKIKLNDISLELYSLIKRWFPEASISENQVSSYVYFLFFFFRPYVSESILFSDFVVSIDVFFDLNSIESEKFIKNLYDLIPEFEERRSIFLRSFFY